jgi:hypothetical protein
MGCGGKRLPTGIEPAGICGSAAMNTVAKFLVLVVCFVACGAGAILAPTEAATSRPSPSNATPVRNHEIVHRTWLGV